ncbi:17283_t:CDS:2, partial [Dentiscutata heterogama]
SILLNLIFKNSVGAQDPSQDLYEEDPAGFLSVVIVGYTSMIFSLIGTFFVFSRVYYRWRNTNKVLSMALKVPFYMCIFDFALVICQSINFTYLAINRTTLSDPACIQVAFVQAAITFYHRLVIACISINTYFRVCREKNFNIGRYDWKIFIPTGIISGVVSFLGLKNYGRDKYWCAVKSDRSKNFFIPFTSTLITLLVLSMCLFCYIKTIRAIRLVKEQQEAVISSNGVIGNNNSSVSPIEEVERKTPSIPYNMYQFLGNAKPWAYCLVIASVNLGGVGNAIFYVINEGWQIRFHGTGKSGSNFDQGNVIHSKDDSNCDEISSKDVTDHAVSILLQNNVVTEISGRDTFNS